MTGVSLNGNLIAVANDTTAAASDGVFEASEVLLGRSTALAPFEEGILEGSGFSELDAPGARSAIVGFNTPYAFVQHEDLTLEHLPGRTAKYLENPANEFGQEFADIVAQRIRAATGG